MNRLEQLTIRKERIKTLLDQVNLEIAQINGTKFSDDELSEMLIQELSEHYNIDISAKSRFKDYIKARQFYYAWMKQNTTLSLKKLGQKFGQDHSTVINALRNFDNFSTIDKKYIAEYHKVIEKFKNKL